MNIIEKLKRDSNSRTVIFWDADLRSYCDYKKQLFIYFPSKLGRRVVIHADVELNSIVIYFTPTGNIRTIYKKEKVLFNTLHIFY